MTITRDLGGGATNQGDVIGAALNGDAFSWENPSNLSLTFSGPMVGLTFNDSDGILTDDPYSGATVVDQQLTAPVTINGVTYTPSSETVRWRNPQPVTVENEYEVTLFDGAGTAYRMVGVSITQGYSTTVVGVTFDGPAPSAGTTLRYIQGVSSYGGSGQSVPIPTAAVCFLAGTMIETAQGPCPVETLTEGQSVLTLDHGYEPIRWIGHGKVCGFGRLAPVCIAAGALGNRRDLYLSPNHRVLLRSPLAELWFGQPEVLVPAKALVNGGPIRSVPMARADYYHILLDTHRMVFSEGIATESLFTGAMARNILDPDALAELYAIFPSLADDGIELSYLGLTVRETQSLMRGATGCALHSVQLCAA
ncbi:MAG: Hint domain-containing protein [Marivita sp.]|uniref:Hint domain-containing protein n=1 Tax=Marivita sp. TaxID=2003365 RepID=UPI003EF53FA8